MEQAALKYKKQEVKEANVALAALHASDPLRVFKMYEKMTDKARPPAACRMLHWPPRVWGSCQC